MTPRSGMLAACAAGEKALMTRSQGGRIKQRRPILYMEAEVSLKADDDFTAYQKCRASISLGTWRHETINALCGNRPMS